MIPRAPVVAGVLAIVSAATPLFAADEPPPPPVQVSPAGRDADAKALAQLNADLTAAFNRGDARATAGFFTETARIEFADGETIEGRAAIAERFTQGFQASPGARLKITPERIRFLTADAALEAGTASVTPAAPSADPELTRYEVAYIKRDGRWLQDLVREEPIDTVEPDSAEGHLRELAWMLGDWVDESDEATVTSHVEWDPSRAFLLRTFKLHRQGELAISGNLRIGWDPREHRFRSWLFDSEGGFAEGTWTRLDDGWAMDMEGVLANGSAYTATHLIRPTGPGRIEWLVTDRFSDEQPLPDATPIILVRQPPRPAGSTQPTPAPAPSR